MWLLDEEEEVEGGDTPPSNFSDTKRVLEFPSLKHPDNGTWRESAKCRGNTELLALFFPETGRGNRRKPIIRQAKLICADCPVRKECFTFAKQNDLTYGVWGGVDFYKASRPELREFIPDDID